MPPPVERSRRMIGRLRRRVAWVLDRRVELVMRRMDALGGQLLEVERGSGDARTSSAQILAEISALREELRSVSADTAALRGQLPPVLRAIVSEESANRRRLEQLRTEPEYAVPFEHPDPLVTLVVPTYDRVNLLTERALPSILAQTHQRLEVLVVGDASPPHVASAVEAIDDKRVRFVNLTQRHAATDPERHWMVGSVPPRNAGYALAKGHWIVDFDDDDAMRPNAVDRVLARARAERLEVVYGKLAAHFADGRTEVLGCFPPRLHQFGWQGAAVHNGLGFLSRDLVAAWFGHPNDWFRAESMLRIGVRFGMVDDILFDYYPARSWQSQTPVPDGAVSDEHSW